MFGFDRQGTHLFIEVQNEDQVAEERLAMFRRVWTANLMFSCVLRQT